ncbi:24126_t:CDS:2 [Cetraspora pellucida]|uniref:24126_t:CDS:1 n=1 Tax=Cetraspora pellucida TaxID=1433469 RepID=A0A9N9AS69_9GLOM|nr:24126_t:CDS:2 [Cetraspora pellucida]
MASTSNVKKSSTQRSSQSSNYNDHQSQPRQILPMSRQSTQSRAYSQALQPQVIVPTQYDDITSNNVSSSKDLTSSMHFFNMEYGNYQTSYFGPVQLYSTSFSNSLHHYQQIRSSQMDQTLASIFCSECFSNVRNTSVTTDTNFLQSICKQCKDKYSAFKFANPNLAALIQQSIRAVSGNMNHPMSVSARSHSMSNQINRSLPLVVPTQQSTPLDQYPMTSHSTDSQSDLSIDYQTDRSISNGHNNGVVNDVFFSDPMINDTIDQHLYFDSDASSDTDILTPNPHYSPNLSPIELDDDGSIWNLIYEDEFDDPKEKIPQSPVNLSSSSETFISSSSSLTPVSSSVPDVVSSSVSQSQSSIISSDEMNSSNSMNTINPSLISSTSNNFSIGYDVDNNHASGSTTPLTVTIDPKFITAIDSSSFIQSNNRNNKPTPVIINPNYIEFGDNIPSPPLQTPELVSDNSLKRRMSYASSSDDDFSDSASTEKQADKKFRVDVQKVIKVNNKKRDSLIVDEKNYETDEDLSSNDNPQSNDDYSMSDDIMVDEVREVHEASDGITDEYQDSTDTIYSDDTDEDDDEEYRPSVSNKKARTGRKNSKSQSKPKLLPLKPLPLVRSGMKSKSVPRPKNKSKNMSNKRSSKASTPTASVADSPVPTTIVLPIEKPQESEVLELTSPRSTKSPTVFETLTKSGIDWCRYCGTTEGVNWRPGPWGKRTLCNKHGCDYKGYGFACKLPRLDLKDFINETIEERERPVLQLFCTICQKQDSFVNNVLVRCEGCPKAFHQKCYTSCIDDEIVKGTEAWYCEKGCQENLRRKRIVVELPRKRLPLMSTPKVQASTSITDSTSVLNSGTASRPRTSHRTIVLALVAGVTPEMSHILRLTRLEFILFSTIMSCKTV